MFPGDLTITQGSRASRYGCVLEGRSHEGEPFTCEDFSPPTDFRSQAPHHSRASWMKFYRRHKHELHHEEGDEPIPAPPEKKMRYSRTDDILLAQFFALRPEGTSDKIFQSFARQVSGFPLCRKLDLITGILQHPHHPWKGWQEHHRIHKAKIDNLIQRLEHGENISEAEI